MTNTRQALVILRVHFVVETKQMQERCIAALLLPQSCKVILNSRIFLCPMAQMVQFIARHFPACWIHSSLSSTPSLPAYSPLDGAAICLAVTIQIWKTPPHWWRKERPCLRRKGVTMCTEILTFRFWDFVYNFINNLAQGTFPFCATPALIRYGVQHLQIQVSKHSHVSKLALY